MLRKMIIGSSFAVAAMSVAMSGARAADTQCAITDQECIREQVIFNISTGKGILDNIPLQNRVGSTIDFSSPQFGTVLDNVKLSGTQITAINGVIKSQGQQIFNTLSGIGGGIFITQLNALLKKLGVSEQVP